MAMDSQTQKKYPIRKDKTMGIFLVVFVILFICGIIRRCNTCKTRRTPVTVRVTTVTTTTRRRPIR